MKIIEFFGISGSGKTSIKNRLFKKIQNKSKSCYDYKEILIKFLPLEEKSLSKRLILKTYLNLKSNKKKISKIFQKNLILKQNEIIKKNTYNKLKSNVINLYLKRLEYFFKRNREKKILKRSIQLIKNSNFSENSKKIYLRWITEELLALYLIKKHKKKLDFIVDSEGLLQRIFIYAYNKKDKKKIIRQYLKICPMPTLVLVTKNKNFIKKKIPNQLKMNILEQKKIYNAALSVFKELGVNYKEVSLKNIDQINKNF
tara:strand:- start:2319 stop:3089 length:771 start_codon:yes stop_codon:yes gene_type:complete